MEAWVSGFGMLLVSGLGVWWYARRQAGPILPPWLYDVLEDDET